MKIMFEVYYILYHFIAHLPANHEFLQIKVICTLPQNILQVYNYRHVSLASMGYTWYKCNHSNIEKLGLCLESSLMHY